MNKISCQNCRAACCKGPVTMELTATEHEHMERKGSVFHTIAEPADYYRPRVIYPRALQIDEATQAVEIITTPGYEYEPLEASLGRFVLLGDCGFLKTSASGWEFCSAYQERPGVCNDFEMAGQKCQLMRLVAGIDSPAEYAMAQGNLLK